MRVCSICGERNEDWMEICQRCGNSIVNSDSIEDYPETPQEKPKAKKKEYNYSYNKNDDSYFDDKPKRSSLIVENLDLKLVIIVLLIILIGLIGYTIYVIS